MQIELFTFSKRYNSTKQATTGTGIRFNNVNLKDDCSIINPVILFAVDSMPVPSVAPSIYNYAYISKFQRYYYIDDWVYTGGIWEARMSVDVLASNKTGIGAVSTMVERSYSSYDGNVVDKFYPVKTNTSVSYVNIASPYYLQPITDGAYVIGIAGYPYYTSTNLVGGVNYFAVDSQAMAGISRWLYDNNVYSDSNITDISEGLFKATFNPLQYFICCYYFPYAASTFNSTEHLTPIVINEYHTGYQGYPVDVYSFTSTIYAQIPDHPQISRGSYLNYEPYSKVTLYVPPIGTIPVDLSFRSVGNYVRVRMHIDTHTGEADVRCQMCDSTELNSRDDKHVFYQTSCQIGVPMQLTQATIENLNMSNTSIQDMPLKAMSTVAMNALADVSGQLLGTTSSYTGGFPTISSTGSNGSYLYLFQRPLLIAEHYQITNEDRAEFGRPLYQVKTINTLSGYIKCSDAHVELPITDEERKKIVSLMNNGFFYE